MTGVSADQVSAQVTSAQQSAIKASCRSDFMAKCSGVTPGGKDALACLQQNVASLSSACKTAVSATLPPTAPAPKAAAPAAAALAPAPADTAEAPAANKPPATETADAPADTPAPAPPPKAVVAKPAKTVAVVAVPAGPTAAQQSAMKQACRSDFMSRCSGVTPGGKDALVCLQRNVAGLSPACKQVVSATMGGAPAPAAAVAAAPATAVVATPAAPTPQQLSAVKFTCRGDFTRHCRGIQPGGPEALACLQSNAARLTPDCKTSLAALGDAVPAGAAATTTTVVAEPERRRLPPGITPVGRIIRRVMERNQ
jgi:hypothetical protein